MLHLQHDPATNNTVVVPSLLVDNTTRYVIHMPKRTTEAPPGYTAGSKVPSSHRARCNMITPIFMQVAVDGTLSDGALKVDSWYADDACFPPQPSFTRCCPPVQEGHHHPGSIRRRRTDHQALEDEGTRLP